MATVILRFVGVYYERDVEVPDEEFNDPGPTVQRVMNLCIEQYGDLLYSTDSKGSLDRVVVNNPRGDKPGVYELSDLSFGQPQKTFQYYIGNDSSGTRIIKNTDNIFVRFTESNSVSGGTRIDAGDIIIWRQIVIRKEPIGVPFSTFASMMSA